MADKLTKLSQAIRLGSTFRPQCAGEYFKDGASCAFGAAWEAITGESKPWPPLTLGPEFYLKRRFGIPFEVIDQIVDLNDDGHTREQIAEWLEGQGL